MSEYYGWKKMPSRRGRWLSAIASVVICACAFTYAFAISDDPDPTSINVCATQYDTNCAYIDILGDYVYVSRSGVTEPLRQRVERSAREQARAIISTFADDGAHYVRCVHGVVSAYEDHTEGILTVELSTIPFELDSACDDVEQCKRKCETMCDEAGHGENACNVEITARGDGGRLCSSTCCTPTAWCFVECLPPDEGGSDGTQLNTQPR